MSLGKYSTRILSASREALCVWYVKCLLIWKELKRWQCWTHEQRHEEKVSKAGSEVGHDFDRSQGPYSQGTPLRGCFQRAKTDSTSFQPVSPATRNEAACRFADRFRTVNRDIVFLRVWTRAKHLGDSCAFTKWSIDREWKEKKEETSHHFQSMLSRNKKEFIP